jgi:hypothetical protein
LPERLVAGRVCHIAYKRATVGHSNERREFNHPAWRRGGVSLGLEDDFPNGMIANQLIEIAKTGERNPRLLCEGALKKLREGLYGD